MDPDRRTAVRHWRPLGVLLAALLAVTCVPLGAPTSSASKRRAASVGSDRGPQRVRRPVVVTPSAAVPAPYQGLYAGLSGQLDGYQSAVDGLPQRRAGRTAPTVRGVELLEANANRGDALFRPAVLQDVSRDIVRFKAMGVTGLTLGIKLPYLLSAYSGADAARYLAFYEKVARLIRAQRMTIDVELSAAFCGTAYSACTFTFPSTVAGFARITAEQARIVVSHLHPNYLTLISEDTTDAALTKDPALDTVAGATSFVRTVLRTIGPHPGVALGAGAATWQPPAFNKDLLSLPIDYLDLHIYPIGPAEVSNLITDTEMARAAGKPLVADEVWLFKTLHPQADPASTAVYRLDNFSFFSPLDARFASITQQWALKAHVAYDSAFWSWQMFGYASWTPALDSASYGQVSLAGDQAALTSMAAGQITPAGEAWAHGP